ncbi:MAG: hypothetical protein JEY99_18255 [Spirochaetales bacterium]|nr:hypothetical protein [Spirochaetales bacterium]
MSNKLWFVTDGVGLIQVCNDLQIAESVLSKYQDDPDFEYYSYYSINLNKIADYPQEFDMAREEGLLN